MYHFTFLAASVTEGGHVLQKEVTWLSTHPDDGARQPAVLQRFLHGERYAEKSEDDGVECPDRSSVVHATIETSTH